MLKLKKYCKDNNFNHEINLFRGYKDVFDNFEFILKILRNKNVPLEETNIKVKILGEHFPREDDFIRPLGIQCNRKEGYVQVDILYFGIPSGNTEPYVDDEETIAAKWFTREELDELNVFEDIKITMDYLLRKYFN